MRILSGLALGALVLAAPLAEAREITRSGSVTGPHGQTATMSGNASRTLGQGATRSRVWTGPQGQSVSRQGAVTPNGDGSATGTRTMTGPQGQSVTRSGTVSVTP
ncbi:hypothetical protein KPL78_24900 [Roseomonas sp. HJA6]|uniref:Uncharacterized protein n=1 Tax=Roseomonas alba TaxID=2846776 RepID=A0ABS7AFN5_9PROT|nr:hypothetical protein [Neoroseomonas alba]MBW6401122.1 hypothetical protein [Neoroseomonas alba]